MPIYRGEERAGVSASYRPTLQFAPFLVGLERRSGSRVTAADLKQAEEETERLLSRRRHSQMPAEPNLSSSLQLDEEQAAVPDVSTES